MSNLELVISASEDENNGTEESQISDDEYFSNFARLQLCTYEPSVSEDSVKENCWGKESLDAEEDTSRIGNTLWCSCCKNKSMATHAESICFLKNIKFVIDK